MSGGVLLPEHEAKARQKQAQETMLRLQVAGSIVGQILPQQLAAEANKARQLRGDGEGPIAFDAASAIDQATNLAIATADALLAKLGLQE